MKKDQNCPCGRPKKYIDCCGKAHQNIINAKTAEDLMRSRYTAFTMANGDYLMDSHHSMTRKSARKNELVFWAKSVKWVKLEIVNTVDGGEDDTEGIVEFKAHFCEGSKKKVMHQNGKFLREFGHWVYFDVIR
ncbi:MAG: YchJ family metal-binding protein [Crocinitomicaceae bacterium]|nr:YchJ family metal-binding protein [Crocinitomicaceae bacterium]